VLATEQRNPVGLRLKQRRLIWFYLQTYMVEKVDVSAGELEGLYLGELVRGEGGHDLAQLGERLVQALRPLPLSNIR